MTETEKILLLGGIAIFVIIIVGILDYRKNKDKYLTKEQYRELEEARLNDEGEITTAHAEVIDLECGVTTIGYQAYKQPKAVKYFIIHFKYDNGDIIKIPVNEEMYEGFDIGLAGTLTLIDGKLKSFELDESCEVTTEEA